jgi:exodeoxyribonuclease V alpha subunit
MGFKEIKSMDVINQNEYNVEQKITLTGMYTKEIFRNIKSLYTCFILKEIESNKSITCVGNIQKLPYNTLINVTGSYKKDNKSRIAFNIDSYEIDTTCNDKSLDFILGLKIPGLNEKKAQILINHFNSNIVSVVKSCVKFKHFYDRCPKEIYPFAKDIYKKIKVMINQYDLSKEVLSVGGDFTNITMLNKRYDKSALSVLKKNPYTASYYAGLSFYAAEQLAIKYKINGFSEKRAEGLLLYAIKESMSQGNTYITINELRDFVKKAQRKQQYYTPFEVVLASTVLNENIVVENSNIYLRTNYMYEKNIATNIKRILCSAKSLNKIDMNIIEEIEREKNIKLSDSQLKACQCAISEGIKVITGGPGTGKTTFVDVLIRYFEKLDYKIKISLSAPTGRAAQNLAAKTNHVAQTTHKMMGLRPYQNKDEKVLKVTKKMEDYVYIIDETSMLDLELANILFQALPSHSIIIFVGDVDQLPSVGIGNIFKDLLESGIEKYVLTQSHRQKENSTIITNARKVNNGDTQLILKNDDFDVVQVSDENVAINFATMYSGSNAQLLTCINKKAVGSYNLSHIIQGTKTFDSLLEKTYGNTTYHIGDKVILLHNNYEYDYYNGDVGVISDIFDDHIEIILDDVFDEDTGRKKEVEIINSNLCDVALAYAITIHKSQGGEYDEVVIIVTNSSINMINRNLLYTAITRAKRKVTIITQNGLLEKAITTKAKERHSSLKNKICHVINK